MTDRDAHDPWPEHLRLRDPVAKRELPSAGDPSARTLLKTIMTEPTEIAQTIRRRRIVLIGAAASVAALGFVGVVALDGDGASAAPLFAAIERTEELESGHIEMLDSRTLDGTTAVDSATVRFRGDDEEIVGRPDPTNPLAQPELSAGGFVPDRAEVRTIDGQSYMRIVSDQTDGQWETSTYQVPGQYVSFAERLRALVENAEQLDTCDSDPGVTAYCLSTTTSSDVQPFMDHASFVGAAQVRIEVDDDTGLLSSFHIEATDVELEAAGGRPGALVYDGVESRWQLRPLDPSWSLAVPDVVKRDTHPNAAEADECLALQDPASVESCLEDLGLELVGEPDD